MIINNYQKIEIFITDYSELVKLAKIKAHVSKKARKRPNFLRKRQKISQGKGRLF
jgi:hypothetical protein